MAEIWTDADGRRFLATSAGWTPLGPAEPEPDVQPTLEDSTPEDTRWPDMDPAAYHGLAGDLVDTIEPHTEADRVALLTQFLTMYGSAVGDGPHAMADGARHPARLFTVLVGITSRSRKGSARRQVTRVMEVADPEWASNRVLPGGLSTGEGVIQAVRDGGDGDPGVLDKRMLTVEEELARVFAVARRDGNTLSPVLRHAWDSGNLRVLTRQNPLAATGAHIAVIGHITMHELIRTLPVTEIANGLANRCLMVLVRRSKQLPEGGNLPDTEIQRLGRLCRTALGAARKVGLMRRSDQGRELWAELYNRMAQDDAGGMVGAMTARAEAQCLRLSVAYALLDGTSVIDVQHLAAAWAVWQYSLRSTRYIFGSSTGNRDADRLLAAIIEAGPRGLDGTQQRDLFGRNKSAAEVEQLRHLLRGRIVSYKERTSGRPRLISRALTTETTQTTKGALP